MIELSITQVLMSWELQSANVLVSKTASNTILLLYLVALKFNKSGCFITAFFLDELISNLTLFDFLSNHQYYLFISLSYCCFYWIIIKSDFYIETILAYLLIILFYVWMSIDAIINNSPESFVYKNYIYIVISIHIFIISSLFPWRHIGRRMGDYIRALYRVSGVSDYSSYLWYNYLQSKIKKH